MSGTCPIMVKINDKTQFTLVREKIKNRSMSSKSHWVEIKKLSGI